MKRLDRENFESVREAIERYDRVKFWTIILFNGSVFFCLLVLKWIGVGLTLLLVGVPILILFFWIWWGRLITSPAMLCAYCGHSLIHFMLGRRPRGNCPQCNRKQPTAL